MHRRDGKLCEVNEKSELRFNGLFYPLLVVSLITVVGYIPALPGPFVFDDVNIIVNNSATTKFPPDLNWLNPSSRPLVGLTFAINHLIGGFSTWGFHLTNVLMHVSCGWLIAALTKLIITTGVLNGHLHRDMNASRVALMISAFWLLHPMSSSAAAYIVQRSEILAACAIVGFQIAVVCDAVSQHRRWQWFAATIFVAGMYCKVNTLSALPITLLLDRLVLSSSWRDVLRQRGWLYLVPVLLGIASFVVMLPSLRRGDAGVGFAEEIPTIPAYLATQTRVLWHYLALCVWPSDLCVDYRWPPVASVAESIPWIALTLGLMATGVWLYWRGMLLGWLILAVFLLLAPTSTFIPVTDIALDHRMYLATAAVIPCLMIIVQKLISRWRWASDAWVIWAIAGSILVAMFIRTSKRANDWNSGFDLWRSAAMVVPHNPRALQNLTNAADQEGRRGELLVVLETLRTQCLTHGQRAPAVASRLAEELMKSGQPIDVEPLLAEAIAGLSPTGPIDERQEHAAARVNLGLLLLQRGDLTHAEEQLKRGLVSDPKQAFAHAILGDLAFQRQEFGIAIDHFQKAVAISPDWDQAKSDLAKAKLAAEAKP